MICLAHDLAMLEVPGWSFDRLFYGGDEDYVFALRLLRDRVNDTHRRHREELERGS